MHIRCHSDNRCCQKRRTKRLATKGQGQPEGANPKRRGNPFNFDQLINQPINQSINQREKLERVRFMLWARYIRSSICSCLLPPNRRIFLNLSPRSPPPPRPLMILLSWHSGDVCDARCLSPMFLHH